MAKPARSPVLGYNHNVRYHGRVFHVQTEDSGPGIPRLYTHLFFAGTILSSKKHEYDSSAPEDMVKGLMQRLHKAMIKELTHGDHDPRIAAFFGARGEPAILEDPAAQSAVVPPVETAAAEAAAASVRPADVRTVAVSGSIDTDAPRTPVPAAPVAAPMTAPPAPPVAVAAVARAPGALPTPPAHHAPRPQVTPRPVVIKPGEMRRPPVVLSSSADGSVVQRNVVINVGGGAPPVNAHRERGTRPRPSIPYVVRDGNYALPTASRGPGVIPVQPRPADETQPIVSSPSRGEPGKPRDTPLGRPNEVPVRLRNPGVPSERTPRPAAPSERTPSDRAFSDNLVSDKRLDEVILEYLSEDGEE